MKKIALLIYLMFLTTSMVSQHKIHQYKYIIVSEKFDMFRSNDMHQTSSLTKFLFNKYGYTSYLNSDKFPDEYNNNRCMALFVNLKDHSGMVRTKVSIQFKDCNNNIVYTSKVGSSKSKDYKTAYHEAIRNAFKGVRALNYKYAPVISAKKKKEVIVSKPNPIKKEVELKPKRVENKVEKTLVVAKEIPVVKTRKVIPEKKIFTRPSTILLAKINKLGYQLLDRKSLVVFTLLKTTVVDVFIIKGSNGILYKKGAVWIAEFYRNNKRVIKEYQIQF
ncbi:MAG: hypothetical protein JKZ00_03870 [Flavobacteriaceae bacterium]|nr:hypothetical protein [Flavobacteriaceae bacterium]